MKFNKQNIMKIINALMIAFAVFISIPAMSQEKDEPSKDQKERVEALKRAFITEKLNLTVAEAEKFWPVFNEFEEKRKEVKKAIKLAHKACEDDPKNEKLLLEKVAVITQKRKEEADLDEKFMKDVLPILGAERTGKLLGIEEEFRKKLMDELKERRGGPGGDGPGPGGRPPHPGGRR
jgi:hypothetical protein